MNLKILIFHVCFFNMDISLIIAPICLKMFIAEICNSMEGSMSQNCDLGFSFYFMLCRRRHFKKSTEKSQKLPFFYHEKKEEIKKKI